MHASILKQIYKYSKENILGIGLSYVLPSEFDKEFLCYAAQFAIAPESLPKSVFTGEVKKYSDITMGYVGGILQPAKKKPVAVYPETNKKVLSIILKRF